MSLPSSWTDHLFGRLSVRYGAAFLRQWPDTDIAIVKADWSDVLDGTRGEAISYALRYLPERPVNAMQFRDICRRAPAPAVAQLPAPVETADPSRVAAIMARALQQPAALESPSDKCARNILRIVAARGGRVSIPQRDQLQAMAHLLVPALREQVARHLPGISMSLQHEESAS